MDFTQTCTHFELSDCWVYKNSLGFLHFQKAIMKGRIGEIIYDVRKNLNR